MKNPKIKIKLTDVDWMIEMIGIIALTTIIVLPVSHYNSLPDLIPRHFDLSGNPDAFGRKEIIWTLPVVGIILYSLLTILNFYPHIFNYLVPITRDNAERQYQIATRMIRVLKTLILAIFCFITNETINTALENAVGLGWYFLPIILVLMFATVGYFIFKSIKSG